MCSHAEADTAIFTIYNSVRAVGNMNPVVIDTEDTDNYVQAAYVANRIPGTLLLRHKNKLVDAQFLCNENMIDCIIPLHIMTGCDHTSGFYGIGKKTVADRVRKSSEARNLLASCGVSLQLTDEVAGKMTKFVVRYVYSDTKSETPAAARVLTWKSQKRRISQE